MHQDYDQMEEINLLDLYQEEIDYLEHQNKTLAESEDPIDQRQYWKNEIVIEYFKNRINQESNLQEQFHNRQAKTLH